MVAKYKKPLVKLDDETLTFSQVAVVATRDLGVKVELFEDARAGSFPLFSFLSFSLSNNDVGCFDQWTGGSRWRDHGSTHNMSSSNCKYLSTNTACSQEKETKTWNH